MRKPVLALLAAATFAVACAAPLLAEPLPTAEQLQRLDAHGAAPPTAAPTQPIESVQVVAPRLPDNGYKLASGDTVRVTVYNEPDLSGEFQVDGSGFIYLPLIDRARAAGLSTQALGDEITAALTNGYVNNPRVSVDVTTYRPFYIIGQVNKPGQYPYVNGMTVVNAIAMAGGFTEKAATGTVYVRAEDAAKEVSEPADAATKIEPGDVIRVESSTIWSVADFLSPILPVLNPACSIVIHTYC